jgi:hypothetical protein
MPAADRPRRDPLKPPQAIYTPEPPKTATSWAPSRIFTRTSAIAKADLQSFLLTCITGWDNYTKDEQQQIIDTLPEGRRMHVVNPESGKFTCPLDAQFVASDDHLKRAITRFQEDVAEGSYAPSWQEKAIQAMREREEGKFDEYIRHHAEEKFGDGSTTPGTTGDPNEAATTSAAVSAATMDDAPDSRDQRDLSMTQQEPDQTYQPSLKRKASKEANSDQYGLPMA